jgi:hypothetical protein
MEMVSGLADLIIPRTTTPGAADAGVHRIIDSVVSKAPPLQKQWRQGLAWANAEAKREGAESFAKLAGSTIDAYYSTREGLVTELGWNANTFLPEFKGCTHKEHQG